MSLRAQLSCWHETGQPASRWQIVLWDFLKSVVDFKFSGKVLCSFKSFAKLNWYISVNTGKSDSSLYDHRMEEWGSKESDKTDRLNWLNSQSSSRILISLWTYLQPRYHTWDGSTCWTLWRGGVCALAHLQCLINRSSFILPLQSI